MRRVMALSLLLGLVASAALGQPQRPQGQIPDRGRPTERGDEIPLFDYDAYFPGVWQFEWRVPESPLGPGGSIEGTEVFSTGDGRYYTSRIEAEGPEGPFTADSRIIYLAEQKVFARHEVDSRGFELFKAGRVGGDLGGFYTIHYETPPFEVGGQTGAAPAGHPAGVAGQLPGRVAHLGRRRPVQELRHRLVDEGHLRRVTGAGAESR